MEVSAMCLLDIFCTLWWGYSGLAVPSVLWLHGTPQKSSKSACLLHSCQHIAVVWSGKWRCSFWSKWGLYQAPLSSLTANCVLAKAWEQDLGGSHMSVSVSWPRTRTVPRLKVCVTLLRAFQQTCCWKNIYYNINKREEKSNACKHHCYQCRATTLLITILFTDFSLPKGKILSVRFLFRTDCWTLRHSVYPWATFIYSKPLCCW